MSTNSPGTSQDTPLTPAPADDTRFANGPPDSADDETRSTFFNYCIGNFMRMDWHDESLSKYFVDDFASFTEENFGTIPNSSILIMYDLLPKRGVYVRKGRGVLIADAFLEVLKEETPCPENERGSTEQPNNARNGDPACDRESVSEEEHRRTDSHHAGMRNENENRSNTGNNNDQQHNTGRGYSNRSNIGNISKAYNPDADRYSVFTTYNFDRKI